MEFRYCLLPAIVALVLSSLCLGACTGRPSGGDSLRGVSRENLVRQQEEILAGHDDVSRLSRRERDRLALLQEQERRLENPWVFGEWRERHGARLMFRDDGSVSVGEREGSYDELGVYKFTDPSEAFEGTWTLSYDTEGNPVVTISRPGGGCFVYFFHDSRDRVQEMEGDTSSAVPTGCLFTKMK